MNRQTGVCFASLAFLLSGGTLWGGFFSTKGEGTRGPTVLTLESDVRAQGLAGAYVGVANEVGTIQWNPAGLQQLSRSEIQFMQANLVEGQKHQVMSVARPVWRRGERETWGMSVSVLSMDEFEVLNDGESVGQARPQESVVGLSYSRSLWRVSGGVTGKMIYAKTFDQSGQAYAVDLGVRSEGSGPWSWGAALTNVGSSLSLGEEKVALPVSVRVGGARSWRWFRGGFLLASVQLDAPMDERGVARAGMEYAGPWVGPWHWAARAGGKTSSAEPLFLGAGVGFHSLEINYVFTPQSDWGDVHRFDLTWRFGSELAAEARRRDLLTQASVLVRESRLLEARPLLDELESLSPHNSDVQSLIQESQKRFAESLDPDTLMVLGQTKYGAGDFAAAADLFRKILLVDPSHVGARAELNKTEGKLEEKRSARLKNELDQAREQELKNRMRLAELRESQGDWAGALAHWQKVLVLGGNLNQTRARVLVCREKLCDQADRAWSQGDAEKALALFEAAQAEGGFARGAQGADRVRRDAAHQAERRRQEKAVWAAEEVKKLYTQGMGAYVSGELTKAKALFLEAQALDPEEKNVRQALSHVDAELKLHPEKQ